jgi:PAS domain S-box-containing protein
MGETAGTSTLQRARGLHRPWRAIDKNLARQSTLQFAKYVLVAVLYYVMVVVSTKLRFSTSSLSLLWPSNALLVATLLLSPKGRWWAYLLAVIPAHITGMNSYHIGLPWLVYQIVFNTALATTCAVILQKFRPEILSFESLRQVLIFLAVAIAAPGVICLAAVYPIARSHAFPLTHIASDGLVDAWIRGWLNNAASLIAFVPTIVVCVTRSSSWLCGLSVRRAAEGLVATVSFVVVTFLVYGHVYAIGDLQQALYLIPVPLLLWAAVRFGPAGASLAITALVCISSWCAYRGEGSFLRSISIDRATVLQISWIMISVPVLALAAVVRERKLARLASTESESRLSQIFEQATVGIVVESLDGQIRNVNPAFCQLLGYTENELIHMNRGSFSSQEDVEVEKPLLRDLVSGERSSYQLERRFRRKDGEEIWGDIHVSLLKESGEKPPLVVGILKDITARRIAESQLHQLTGRLLQAQEDERRRISRELHDNVGQQAALLANDLGGLRCSVSAQSGITEQIGKLHQLAAYLATDIHQLSHELHSSRLQHLGLGPALSELCTRVASQRPIAIETRLDHLPQQMPQDVALCLFRVAQEALTNVLKHSEAQTVIVQGEQDGATVRVRISDDGVGFDPAIRSSGIGLTSMRERLRLVDGELLLHSAPHQGTEVIASVRIIEPSSDAGLA